MAILSSLICQPTQADPTRLWPLVIFLHGIGERGNDLDLVRKHGPPAYFDRWDLPIFCAAPQCPADAYWADIVPELEATLDHLLESYPIDPARVSLTGFSLGGIGTWQWAIEHPERFTAIAPVAGGGFDLFHPLAVHARPRDLRKLRGLKIHVFHGRADEAVALIASRMMIWACRLNGVPVEKTFFPEADHAGGARLAYEDDSLVRWLSEQSKESPRA